MDEQMQQIVQLVQAAMSGDQQANQQIEQIMLAAQLGDQQAQQLAQIIQQIAQELQGGGAPAPEEQPMMARMGAKLDYIAGLRGKCPQGTEAKFYREGGRVCKKCEATLRDQLANEIPSDPIEAFKCGRKIKKADNGLKANDKITPEDTIRNKRGQVFATTPIGAKKYPWPKLGDLNRSERDRASEKTENAGWGYILGPANTSLPASKSTKKLAAKKK